MNRAKFLFSTLMLVTGLAASPLAQAQPGVSGPNLPPELRTGAAAAMTPAERATAAAIAAQRSAGTADAQSPLRVPQQPGRPQPATPEVAEPARYADLQQRLDTLNRQNRACPVPYHLAKAQAWLNFSRDQFHERVWQGGIRDTTFEQARLIIETLEAGREPSLDTPLVSGADRLRDDLWRIANQIKRNLPQHLCCAQKETAFCEVQLVWSGHALRNVGGWRNTAPHIRQAEDLCREAEQLRCPAPPPAPVIASAPPPPAPAPTPVPAGTPSYERITLGAHALFHHDKSAAADLLPEGRRQLDQLIERLKQVSGVQRIVVTGHADITNSTGQARYNQQLSQARARTVAGVLRAGGVNIGEQDAYGMGDAEPVVACKPPPGSNGITRGSASRKAMQAYHACLQPNRRVEIEILGSLKPVR